MPVKQEMVDALTDHVHRIEAMPGILSDWSIPGEHSASAAYDLGRTVCRRAERHIVRLVESGEEPDTILVAYLNRLSDLLWLFGRLAFGVRLWLGQAARLLLGHDDVARLDCRVTLLLESVGPGLAREPATASGIELLAVIEG